MADFSEARRAVATEELITRLKALKDLEDARDIPDEETKSALAAAILRLGEYEDEVQSNKATIARLMGAIHAWRTMVTQDQGAPDFKRAAAHLHVFSTFYDRMWAIVRTFEKAVDETGLLNKTGPDPIRRLIWKYIRHDLAGELGSSMLWSHRNAVAALKGLEDAEPKV
ncbi:hypothetical protein D869_gp187 [Caulobacter phage CcrRogue]|uniref:Uncharacterized protein n=1 Tax=Caulobacter phage CcrRogue TaxID=2927986 RepID=K4K3B5_9CAUD|nr:hypothetical protein D869_gp187 [Caulobacter phage CcrRogue]AFU86727.1 hypothetical protein CcrRogue_gp245 [Caulobacter phage CcrRogue]